MKFKMIASDYDHTIADTPRMPTPYTLQTIEDYKKTGGLFTLVTGRTTRDMLLRIDGIYPSTPIITTQGAIIYDTITKTNIKEWTINSDISVELIQDILDHDLFCDVTINDIVYLVNLKEDMRKYCSERHLENELEPNICDRIKKEHLKVQKVMIVCEPSDAIVQEKYFSDKYKGKLNVSRSAATYVEFTDITASKANAILWLAEQYNVRPEEIMCLGDSTNDASMFRIGAFGVAMGNAMPELIALADYVAPRCEDEGWAKVVHKYCIDVAEPKKQVK